MTVFYNDSADVYFDMWPKYGSEIVFCSGSGNEERKADDDLSLGPANMSDSKKGIGHDEIFDRMGVWTSKTDGPLVALKYDSNPDEHILLTSEGFVYFGEKEALIVRKANSTITSQDS